MKVGFVGLGKLGFPVAVAMAYRGVEVVGYDLDPAKMSYKRRPEQEVGLNGFKDLYDWVDSLLDFPTAFSLRFGSMQDVVDEAEIIFVAVQTPHQPQFEGHLPITETPRDFDYTPLKRALMSLSDAIKKRPSGSPVPIVALISTVLPGTVRTQLRGFLPDWVPLVYTPSFIAMGTVVPNFLNPEFVLIGRDTAHYEAAAQVSRFFGELLPTPVPHRLMSIESAEATKMLYNTMITWKIILANTAMELCHKINGADVRDVTHALKSAHKRLISTAYMDGGMGDGGGCHPRDNIALAWLATTLGLSCNPFGDAIRARERQAAWLAGLCVEASSNHGNWLPVVIAGYAFKPETNITTGSPALLVAEFLKGWGHTPRLWDHHVNPQDTPSTLAPSPSIILLGCKHRDFMGSQSVLGEVAVGSTIIDPFRIVSRWEGITVKPVGVGV